MRMDEDWRALVPAGVARVLEDVAADAAARTAAAREAGAT